jgi:GxxExxY protein
MVELILKDEVYAVVGAAFEVYWQLGNGFLEPVYQEAFAIELKRRSIPFEAKKRLTIQYKGQCLLKEYEADLVCYDQIVVELKSEIGLSARDVSQLINYLKATGLRVGVLINFGSRGKLEWKRFVI